MNIVITDMDLPELGPLTVLIFQGAGLWIVDDILRTDDADITDRLTASMKRIRSKSRIQCADYWKDVVARCTNVVHKIRVAHISPDIPQWCTCGITGQLMSDPVICPSGISYDRLAIIESIKQKSIDPIAGTPLHKDNLTTNLHLREAILNIVSSHNIKFRDEDLEL